MGLPEQGLQTPEDIAAFSSIQDALGKPAADKVTEKQVKVPGGYQSFEYVNGVRGDPVGEFVPDQKRGGFGVVFDDEGKPIYMGEDVDMGKAAAMTTGREKAKYKARVEQKRPIVSNILRNIDRIEQAYANAPVGASSDVVMGSLGRRISSVVAAAKQTESAMDVLGVGGLTEATQYLTQNPNLVPTTTTSAVLQQQEYALATARAMLVNRTGNVGLKEVQRAAEANAPIFSGDPVQARAALAELRHELVESYNADAGAAEVAPIDIAPATQPAAPAGVPVFERGPDGKIRRVR